MSPAKLLSVYVDADVLFRAATASHEYTAALVVLRLSEFTLIDLVTAVHVQAKFLFTFNVRDYYPTAVAPQIITPGEFVALSRQAIYHVGHTGES